MVEKKKIPKTYDYEKNLGVIKDKELRGKGGNGKGKRKSTSEERTVGKVKGQRLLKIVIGLCILFIGYQFVVNFMLAPSKYKEVYKEAYRVSSKEVIGANKAKDSKDEIYSLRHISVASYARVKDLNVGKIRGNITGELYIPGINLTMPIVRGTKELGVVAGELKGGQALGEGNYAIGSNSLNNKKLLFTSIIYMEKGDKIFITDKENLYLYEVISREKMSKEREDMIEDTDGKKEITLVTGYKKGEESGYVVVKGELKAKASYEKAGSKLQSIFEGK